MTTERLEFTASQRRDYLEAMVLREIRLSAVSWGKQKSSEQLLMGARCFAACLLLDGSRTAEEAERLVDAEIAKALEATP